MKAVVNTRYGPPEVLEIHEIPTPAPQAGEVLVKVHATTATRTDDGLLRADPFIARFFTGLLRPKTTVLCMDFAGVVEEVGSDVDSFFPGDRVFGMSPDDFGAHAEYLCVPDDGDIATMPAGLPFTEAVVCEGAWYANTYLQALGLGQGHSILIYGASGAIGAAAVQLAKSYGTQTTAVAATKHLDLARSLGADRVIDYTAEDFTAIGETFDFVFDAVGKTSYFRCRKLLKPGGVFTATDFGPWCSNPLLAVWSKASGSNRVIFPLPKSDGSFVRFLKPLLEAGRFRAMVDRTYPLADIAEAYRYVHTRQKTGIVVIEVRKNPEG